MRIWDVQQRPNGQNSLRYTGQAPGPTRVSAHLCPGPSLCRAHRSPPDRVHPGHHFPRLPAHIKREPKHGRGLYLHRACLCHTLFHPHTSLNMPKTWPTIVSPPGSRHAALAPALSEPALTRRQSSRRSSRPLMAPEETTTGAYTSCSCLIVILTLQTRC